MMDKYIVSRNILSGHEEEYRALKELAKGMGAIAVEDQIDLDCYDYPVGEYGKYYLCWTFASEMERDAFVMATNRFYKK